MNNEYVHVWSRCHGCDAQPIVGNRFACLDCPAGPDNDLCELCYSALRRGALQHPKPGSYAQLSGFAANGPHRFESFAGRPRRECLPWREVPEREAHAAIQIPNHFVVRPEFCSHRESFVGACGFVVNHSRPLFLTALHVLSALITAKGIDCSIGSKVYSGRELAAVVTRVNLFDVFAASWMMSELGAAGPMLALSSARLGEEEPFCERDFAAFHLKSIGGFSLAKLAPSCPSVGDVVWLAARPDPCSAERAIAAVVVEATERTLIFRYSGKRSPPSNTSGAPLLDANGEVVGMHIGAGSLDGQQLGHANPVASIRRHLQSQVDGPDVSARH